MVGQENKMIRFIYRDEMSNIVEMYEEEQYTKCSRIIEQYEKSYAKYGCEIDYGLFWNVNGVYEYHNRPPFKEGYECWFGYSIKKDGQCVCCDETENAMLGSSDGFLYIRKIKRIMKKSILEVTYVDDTDDLIESLERDLLILQEILTKS